MPTLGKCNMPQQTPTIPPPYGLIKRNEIWDTWFTSREYTTEVKGAHLSHAPHPPLDPHCYCYWCLKSIRSGKMDSSPPSFFRSKKNQGDLFLPLRIFIYAVSVCSVVPNKSRLMWTVQFFLPTLWQKQKICSTKWCYIDHLR